ncbi:perlucin-like protein [Mizuhopecten yessoensis]|uniref:Brevican core protein n=1 Tax=Mizuhopecten yessoensis TaxID=6573 RepID=A0A210QBB7_MIZYE|nr:perlucin-like protein [Mizuhopecten yessoensis]OWF46013.1 Brevican core protein [Mizuhopecten yessoensis]
MLLNAAILGVLLVFVEAQSSCPEGWVSNIEACYHISRDTEEWVTAEEMCKLYGATLVQIETLEEDKFLSEHLRNYSQVYNDHEFWIGLSDWALEGNFIWVPEGLTPLYTNWGPGEPDNDHKDQHCTIIYTQEHYQWYDRTCNQQYSYICEKTTSANPGIIIG